jgi:hypothetical protein
MPDAEGEGAMGSQHSSTPTAHADFGTNRPVRVCGRRIPDENRERKTMHAATTRSIIAAAGLAAIGLVAWPQHSMPLAQHAMPTVHRDVALVDADTTLLDAETTFDTALWNDVLGPTGAEEQLFSALATATSTSEATTLLDATGASPIYSGDFDGAESRFFEGVYLDTLAHEDELNQALGITPSASETAILADYTSLANPPLPSGDVLPVVGASGFDTDLTSIANGEFALATGDFEGWLGSLATDSSGLGDLSTLFSDLTSSLDFSNLSGDLTSLLSSLTGLL